MLCPRISPNLHHHIQTSHIYIRTNTHTHIHESCIFSITLKQLFKFFRKELLKPFPSLWVHCFLRKGRRRVVSITKNVYALLQDHCWFPHCGFPVNKGFQHLDKSPTGRRWGPLTLSTQREAGERP